MTETIVGVEIPDTVLVREVTELVRDAADDLLLHHFPAGAPVGILTGRRRALVPDGRSET
jgi:hypothetical protein